ncbi:Hypothetical predicted protein [Cloeon dipterum]|uniref:Uncharacterized protein n=1 Tax=Cloeon dipterum TaxID=197152 RepID=A0A8S1E282_9INSE|nr:Hypothetical predicted protein [Cloeon dipterum]
MALENNQDIKLQRLDIPPPSGEESESDESQVGQHDLNERKHTVIYISLMAGMIITVVFWPIAFAATTSKATDTNFYESHVMEMVACMAALQSTLFVFSDFAYIGGLFMSIFPIIITLFFRKSFVIRNPYFWNLVAAYAIFAFTLGFIRHIYTRTFKRSPLCIDMA